jgi:signal transduction histidine kinase/ABC-type uncharacterized transport system substrate-binding protein
VIPNKIPAQAYQKSCGRVWFAFLLLVIPAYFGCPSALAIDQAREVRRVLVLSELGPSSPAVSLMSEEIRAAVEELPYEVELYSESINTPLFADPNSQSELGNLYAYKYRDRKIDVIVAMGPAPIKFLAASRTQFLPGTPIVICGSSMGQADNPVLDPSFTGAWMPIEPEKTVEVATRLRPGIRHVAVVGGRSRYDRHLEELVKRSEPAFGSHLDFIYLTELSMPTLLSRVRNIAKDTVVLFTSMQLDAAGNHYINASQSLPMVAAAASVPTFGLADTLVGRGAVGGYVISFGLQGRIAADATVKILMGMSPKDIPIRHSNGLYMFDWRALKRWGISEQSLPPGSVILYREPTLWEKHSRLVIATALAIFLMALLSAYLLVERRRRSMAERDLEEEMNFQRLISELSTFFIDLRPDQVDVGIDSALQRVRGALALDRVSVDEFVENGKALRITHGSSDQRGPQVSTLIPSSESPYLTSQIMDNRTVIISSLDRRVDMSTNERELMRSRGVQAGVFVPLEARGSVLGALAFESGLERRWSEEVVMQCTMLGQVFASALIRKKEDEALLTSELLKDAILSSLSGDVAVIDHNGKILGTNAWAEHNENHNGMFSEEESVQGANILDVYQRSTHMTDPLGTQVADGIRAVLEGQLPQFEVEWSQESPGGMRWFITSATPVHPWERERGAVVTRTEITARKQAEEERLELSGRLIDLQEKERSRLARELHDDFNQRLAVLAIDLERTAQTVAASPLKASQKLHELWSQATEIGTDLHSLSHRLHSSTLEGLGLVLGLSSLCEEFAAQHEIQVDFMHDRVPRFIPPDIALCLFRIAQEALRNVKRHSGASRAEVRLEGKGDVISLSISDEGIGFALSRVSTGLGVRSMQERLRLLTGRFEIRSQPGVGTVIQVTVPLPPKEFTSVHTERDRSTRRDVYATD